MDAHATIALIGAGLAGGLVTAIVGGASLITFPAMLAAGLPPVIASASNTVALTPGNLAAALADRERMPDWDRSFLGLTAVVTLGSVAGAVLLLVTPTQAFTALIPLLIGGATLLFAASPPIGRWLASRSGQAGAVPTLPGATRFLLIAPVSVYGGYFGAGMSVMLLAILSIGFARDLRAANVLKNLLSGLTSLVALIVFVAQQSVAWTPTVAMMAGALAGGFIGGRLVRLVPAPWVRATVIVAGSILTVIYARRYWMP
jgi:uncharacterized membrane protein YfcA